MEHARAVALRILVDIEEKGSFSHIVLRKLTGMERREMALVTELVNGVTRKRLTLDYILDQFLKFPISSLTYAIRNDLRMGAYQLLHMRIPPRAAVDEAVKLAYANGHPGVAKLVNGVLRNLDRSRDKIIMPKNDEANYLSTTNYLSITHSLPGWIAELWIRERGFEEAEKLGEMAGKPTFLTLRCNTLKTSREALLSKFLAAGIDCAPGLLPEAILLGRSVAWAELPGYDEGEWYVQGEGAMLASRMLDPRPNDSVLDIGAAPGGKTTHLAELAGDQARILAIDINSSRLELIKANARRLGIRSVEATSADVERMINIPTDVDRIFVDVPCSGLGMLSRKPDIRWHQSEEEAEKLPALQLRMLEASSKALKKGGSLVYSTCTVRRAENEEVVAAFLERNQDFRRGSIEGLLPEEWRPDARDGMIQLLPHRHGTEGFFIARLERER